MFAMSFLLVLGTVSAASAKTQDIPDANGTYNVPGHPNLKVRVFVHNPKTKSQSTTCSLSDPGSGPVVNPTGWHLPGSFTYNLNVSSAPLGVVRTNFASFAGQAFSTWQSAVNSKVTFTQGLDTSVNRKGLDGKNIVAWGSAPGSALAITYTWYNTQTNQVVESDTIMNKKFSWSWMAYSTTVCPNSSAYDAQDILTHELGHWMGLDDEYTSSFSYNTMYGYGSKGEIFKDTLTTGDVTGVNNIYK